MLCGEFIYIIIRIGTYLRILFSCNSDVLIGITYLFTYTSDLTAHCRD